jgi:PAS domain S-box-containing protein
MKILSDERYGMVMIIATLLVILLIGGQFLMHRQNSRLSSIKAEGRNTVRLLANIPFTQLLPVHRSSGILDLLNNKQADSGFAYAAIVDVNGQPIAVTTSGESAIPLADVSSEKSLWATEHEIADPNNTQPLLEFRAPVLNEGELAGYVRIGYFKPHFELTEISFIAQLALPIFLLVPLAYLLIRRELEPLKKASVEINSAMHKQHIETVNSNSADFHDFMSNFQRFVTEVDKRFKEANEQTFKIKASGLALSYQRQRTESALQALPDAILVMDENGKAAFANSKLAPLLGVNLEQVVGSDVYEWCKNPDLISLLTKFQNSQYLHLQRPESLEYHPPNNTGLTILVTTYPLFSPKDSEAITGTLVIFRDKTSEVLASQARDQFISHVAHELKSPLNVIQMYAESLLDPATEERQRISSINVINDEVERLSNLISNLLNISKIEAGNINLNQQRVKLGEFLTDTFDSVARSGQNQHITFEFNIPRTLPNIQFDKDLLRIALNNILTNAVKYNNPGGKVSLLAEENDDDIIIKISDTGIGIAPHDQQHIFEKFYRSQNDDVTQRSGHGLGLALAKEIINLHQGRLKLQSELGQGSEFTITLKKTSTFLK